jgi:hypothetical protein
MLLCECRVAWQMFGFTPLHIASQKGHVECVWALLGGGAAINQALVGSTSVMARPRGGLCVWVSGSLRACMGWQRVGCSGIARVGGFGRELIKAMPYFRSWGDLR